MGYIVTDGGFDEAVERVKEQVEQRANPLGEMEVIVCDDNRIRIRSYDLHDDGAVLYQGLVSEIHDAGFELHMVYRYPSGSDSYWFRYEP